MHRVLLLLLLTASPIKPAFVQAALPHLQLREMTLGASLDYLVQGVPPGASGQIVCATGTASATWQTPEGCIGSSMQLANGGNTTTNTPVVLGWTSWVSPQAEQLFFGDPGTVIQAGYGQRMQLVSYHGVAIYGARALTTQLAFEPGGSSGDWALEVHSGGANALKADGAASVTGALAVTGATTATGGLTVGSGTAISASYRTTWTNPGTSFSGPGCADSLAHAFTGAVTGAECAMGTGGVSMGSMQCSCYFPSNGFVALHCCTPASGTVTLPAGTYSFRSFNP